MEATLKRRILTQDVVIVVRVLEVVVMYSDVSHHSTDMLKKIDDDYKGKLAALDEDHKKPCLPRMRS